MLRRLTASPAFRHRDFRVLLGAAAGHSFGMSGEQVVVGLLVFEMTGSTAWVGAALALYYLPLLLFGMVAGAVSDWMDRRRLLRRLELALVGLMALFGLLAVLDAMALWSILLLTFCSGSVRAMQHPVRISYAYDLAGAAHVVAGLGLLNLGVRSGQLVGALAAGSAMEWAGAHVAFAILALAHTIALLVLRRLETAGGAAESERVPMWQNIREYVQEMRHNHTLLLLAIVTASVEIFGFSFATVLPELATERLDVGAQGLGWMHAARAFGGMTAGMVLASAGSFRRHGLAYLLVIYAFAASLVLLTVATTLMITLVALVIVAAMAAASDVLTQSMMQLSVPNKLRGRAMGAWVFAVGSSPLGHLEMGALAAAVGVSSALGINAAVLLVVALLTTLVAPNLRRL